MQQSISCHVWNSIEKPIGATQLMIQENDNWNRYNELIHALNYNGYIVYGARHKHHDITTDIAKHIISQHRLPLFLITNNFDTQQIKNLTICTSLFRAVISVAEKRTKKWWHLGRWSFFNIDNHAPLLVINGGASICKTTRQLSRNLYNTYKDYNPEKLTVILYPDALSQDLINNYNYETQNDILDYLNNIKKITAS